MKSFLRSADLPVVLMAMWGFTAGESFAADQWLMGMLSLAIVVLYYFDFKRERGRVA